MAETSHQTLDHEHGRPKRIITEMSICSIFRNNEAYLKTFFIPTFKRIEHLYPSIKFNYYLYENDSTDETPTLVKNLGGVSEILKTPSYIQSASKSRLDSIAAARDRLMTQRPFKGEWCMFIDSNMEFSPNLITQFIAREIPDDASCVTCFGMEVHKACRKHLNCPKPHYYDTLALVYKSGGSGYENMKKNAMRGSPLSCCPFSDKEDVDKWGNGEMVETQSSFGGVAFYKTEEVNKPTMFYGECVDGKCDHTYFNSRLEGKIYADPTLEVYMTEKTNPPMRIMSRPVSQFVPQPFSQCMPRASSRFSPNGTTSYLK